MATVDRLRDPLINQYYDNSVMLDTSLAIDGFFEDVAMLYPYKNWFKGEVVAGPSVKRYWVTIVLKYDWKEMPDPQGAKVLTSLGCKVFYKKFKQKVGVDVVGPNDLGPRKKPKMRIEPCWLVKVVIPKKFIENEELKGMDQLDDEVDVDQIEDSLNQGADNTARENNDGIPGQEEFQPEQQPAQMAPAPAPLPNEQNPLA